MSPGTNNGCRGLVAWMAVVVAMGGGCELHQIAIGRDGITDWD